MSTYHPDKWVILEVKTPKESLYKILASWAGSYLYGASWKLSSGIVSVEEKEYSYEFLNHSGSTYICSKEMYGMTGYTVGIYTSFIEENDDEMQIRLLDEDEAKKLQFS